MKNWVKTERRKKPRKFPKLKAKKERDLSKIPTPTAQDKRYKGVRMKPDSHGKKFYEAQRTCFIEGKQRQLYFGRFKNQLDAARASDKGYRDICKRKGCSPN